jgi:hypothetical protein
VGLASIPALLPAAVPSSVPAPILTPLHRCNRCWRSMSSHCRMAATRYRFQIFANSLDLTNSFAQT